MGEQNLIEELLPWIAVIIYFGYMACKLFKDKNKKVEKPAQVSINEKPEIQQLPVEGVSEISKFEFERADEVVKTPSEAAFSPRKRALRRAVLWSEILKTKF